MKPSAIILPMPREPPVISAVRPFRENSSLVFMVSLTIAPAPLSCTYLRPRRALRALTPSRFCAPLRVPNPHHTGAPHDEPEIDNGGDRDRIARGDRGGSALERAAGREDRSAGGLSLIHISEPTRLLSIS